MLYNVSVDIREIRRINLESIIGEEKRVDFAERAGLNPSQLSQVLSGTRNIGDKLARRIERNIMLKPYALDQQVNSGSGEIDADALVSLICDVNAALKATGRVWSIERAVRLSVDLYTIYATTGEMPDVRMAIQLQGLMSDKTR